MMEQIQINCPHCGNTCEVEGEIANGQHLICPFCSEKFVYSCAESVEPLPGNAASVTEEPENSSRSKMDIKCPHCGTGYELEASAIGERVQCGVCNNEFVVATTGGELPIGGDAPNDDRQDLGKDVELESGTDTGTSRRILTAFFRRAKIFMMAATRIVSAWFTTGIGKARERLSQENRRALVLRISEIIVLVKSEMAGFRNRRLLWFGICGLALSLILVVILLSSSDELKAGTVKTITLPGGATMELVYCPPGEFMMGSPADEESRKENEVQHRVVLTRGFWIGKFEVTQEQWESVMGSNPSKYKERQHPVEQVLWQDCQTFCLKVGGGVRLPTEAEWEYACRAGSKDVFSGNGKISDMGWVEESKNHHVVGEKRPNAWGLYDMHGNVCEWCHDVYGDYPTGVVTNPIGPITLSGDDAHVQRGGSYALQTRISRSAARFAMRSGTAFGWEGFRVACTDGSAILNQKSEGSHDAVNEQEEHSSKASQTNADLSEYHGPRKGIKEHIKKYANCRICAITQASGDIVVSGANNWAATADNWAASAEFGSSSLIIRKLYEISKAGQRIVDVSLTDQGRFIILYDKNAASWNDIPQEMERRLRIYHDNYENLCSATLNDAGDWIIISSEHFACSDTWLKTWIEDGQEKFGRLLSATVSSDAAVAVFESGFKFFGNVPAELKNALKEAPFDVRVIKIAGAAWFFANADGSQYQASM